MVAHADGARRPDGDRNHHLRVVHLDGHIDLGMHNPQVGNVEVRRDVKTATGPLYRVVSGTMTAAAAPLTSRSCSHSSTAAAELISARGNPSSLPSSAAARCSGPKKNPASVGVSNFTEDHLTRIIDATGVTRVVNQVELHPRFPQEEMRRVHERLGVRTQAWSPMGKRNAPLQEPVVTAPAQRLGVTPGQVILRWHVQLGSLPIPKSSSPERQRQNLDVFGFELTDDEMTAISGLADPDGRLFGGDPKTHEEM